MAAPYVSQNVSQNVPETTDATTTQQPTQPVQAPVQQPVQTRTILVPQPIAMPQASSPDNVTVEVQPPSGDPAPIPLVDPNQTSLNMLLIFLVVALVLLAVPVWIATNRR